MIFQRIFVVQKILQSNNLKINLLFFKALLIFFQAVYINVNQISLDRMPKNYFEQLIAVLSEAYKNTYKLQHKGKSEKKNKRIMKKLFL